MKRFLEKHILFPKKYGSEPYFYLIFMFPAIPMAISLPLFEKIIFIILVLGFLKSYREGYKESDKALIYIIIQLVISAFLAVNPWFSYVGLQIFTGFEIGFSRLSDKKFKRVVWLYYLTALTYFVPFIRGVDNIPFDAIIWILVSFLFTLGCIPFSRRTSKNYSLKSENKMLMEQVRQLERERIAYDLHDNIGQTFSIITLKAELAERLLDKKRYEESKKEIAEIEELSRNSLTLVREIVAGMKEKPILQLLKEERKNLILAGIELKIENEQVIENWRQSWQDASSALLKEALTNAIRYSKASLIRIEFAKSSLKITDDGIGLGKSKPSHGMMSMHRRVEEVGGRLSFESEQGLTIHIQFPEKDSSAHKEGEKVE